VGDYMLTSVALDQGQADWKEGRGIWCTNCHSQLSQEIWKKENCTDLINNECASGENPRTAASMTDLAAQLEFPLATLEMWADPKDPGRDPDLPESGPDTRTADETHTIWRTDPGRAFAFPVCQFLRDPTNPAQDATVATIEVSIGATANCDSPVPFGPVNCSDEDNGGAGPTFYLCGNRDADQDFSVKILDFCTTPDCVTAAQGTLLNATALAVPFSAATDARDHWLSAGEPHCADCHAAPYVEQSGNFSAYSPFNYPRKAALMRYSRGHQDITCQGCHESTHGLYPVTPTIDSTW
jgi:hypothetical protein